MTPTKNRNAHKCIRLLFAMAAPALALSSFAQSAAPAIRGEPIAPLPPAAASKAVQPGVTASVPVGAAPVPASPVVQPTGNGTVQVGFDKLAGFPFEPTLEMLDGKKYGVTASQKTAEKIPAAIKALDKKQISLTGFVIAVKVPDGYVTDFMVLRNPMACCFGTAPNLNEIVEVHMSGKGVKVSTFGDMMKVEGTLFVGEYREKGWLNGIYRMEAQKVSELVQ
jgi:hypothetical protein